VANEWNKTAFVEFETMLRRHLRSGAAPVAACAGFDLDAASAYLEGALDEWRRESYESHLAGCAICRRHLIELSRVAQAAPSFESRPAATPGRIPAWNRLKETVAGWFDLSSWNLKWQIAGATGAAFLILIAAFGVQLLRRAPDQAHLLASRASAVPSPAAEQSAQGFLSQTPEPLPQDADTPADKNKNLIALQSGGPAIPVPSATVRAIENPLTPPVEVAGKIMMTVDSNLSSEAPPATRARDAEAEKNGRNDSSKGGESVLGDFKVDSRQFVATKDAAPGAQDLPPYQGNLVKNKPETPSKAPAKKTISQQAIDGAREMIKGAFSPLRKGFTESERKEIPDTQEAPENESPKLMVKRLRGKVFRREKGTWIDQEYKPEMQQWRRWTLKRGSEEYKRALAKEPLLKEFFDLAPILVVWNDEIYKVLK
jgi:Putative zinc-finger